MNNVSWGSETTSRQGKTSKEVAMFEAREPATDEITHRAYALCLRRGCKQEIDAKDWSKAEKEVSEESVGVQGL